MRATSPGWTITLREQMSTYQTPSEEDEAIDDWSGRFPLLRSDTQIAINLVNKAIDVPAPQFQVFSDPETLAAAILWSPITMKSMHSWIGLR